MSKVQSVDRALKILEVLSDYPDGIGISDLARELDLAKSSTHRLLATLMSRSYVTQNKKTENYSLGTKIIELSGSILDNLNVRNVAKSELEELCKNTNEVVHLCIYENGEVIYIDKYESNQTIRMHSRIGKRAMIHSTGVGKVLLSGMEKEEISKIIEEKGLPAKTPKTITTYEELIKRLEKIKEIGYEIDDVENEEGIRCIAAPIFNHVGKIIASFSISGPDIRMTREFIENELVEPVLETSEKISRQMGYIRKG